MGNIQEDAKRRVNEILGDYDVMYIDYSTKDDSYAIRLERKDEDKQIGFKQLKTEKGVTK